LVEIFRDGISSGINWWKSKKASRYRKAIVVEIFCDIIAEINGCKDKQVATQQKTTYG
jgi:hypothetical protein